MNSKLNYVGMRAAEVIVNHNLNADIVIDLDSLATSMSGFHLAEGESQYTTIEVKLIARSESQAEWNRNMPMDETDNYLVDDEAVGYA